MTPKFHFDPQFLILTAYWVIHDPLFLRWFKKHNDGSVATEVIVT